LADHVRLWLKSQGLRALAAIALSGAGAEAAESPPSDYARCVDAAALTPALAAPAEAQQLQAACSRAIARSGEITSAALAEALKVRGQLLVALARFTPTGAVDLRITRQALADYNLVLAIDPLSVESYKIRGEIRGTLSDFKGAMEDETTAINMRPTLYAAYFSRAEIYLQQNRANMTRDIAEAAIGDYRVALQSPEIRAKDGQYIEGVISGLQSYLKPQAR
jgi:tetratricopeptide (TPR) repeat protein